MKNIKQSLYGAALISALMFGTTAAQAGGHILDKDAWEVSVGAGAMYSPKYEGSDNMEFEALPMLDVEWNNRVFLNPGDGLGVHVINNDDFEVDVSVGYEEGRKESDDRTNLNGLGDVDGAATANISASYELGPVEPYVELSKHMGGSNGLLAEIGAETMIPLGMIFGERRGMHHGSEDGPHGPALNIGVSSTWADDNYMEDFFGVTSTQSGRSGLAQYNASSGFKSVDAEVGVMYPLGDSWAVNAMVEYSQLIGDAADSPIVKDKGQFSGGMFISYKF